MTSLPAFVSRALGFSAAQRGRALSRTSPQHDGERFRNVKPRPAESLRKTLGIVWNILLNKPRGTAPTDALPIDALTRAQLDAAPDRSLYRPGHSTMLLKLRGQFWLTDPVFAERASPFRHFGPKRFHAPPVALADLPPLRGVILSHDHYDHLDRETVLALAQSTGVFLTPLGVGDRLIEWGIDASKVRQFDWWQGTEVDGVQFTATPAQHFSGRSLFDGNSTLWASWVIVDDDLRVFFSGDTGYFPGFAEIGAQHGPFDATMIQIGAYSEFWPKNHTDDKPNPGAWPEIHMTPDEGLQAHLDLQGGSPGGVLLPIHWGTFNLAFHPWAEPAERTMLASQKAGQTSAHPRPGEPGEPATRPAGVPWWRDVAVAPDHGWGVWPPVLEAAGVSHPADA